MILNWILTAYIASFTADAATTHVALQKGAVEVVFPTQNPWVIDGIVAGEAVTGHALTKHLYKDHPKLAVTIAIAATAVHGYAAIHNIHVMRQMR